MRQVLGGCWRERIPVSEPGSQRDDLVLALNGALLPASVGLMTAGVLLADEQLPEPRVARADVLAAVERVVSRSGCRLADLDAVATIVGPGPYTTLRVGLASAMGLVTGLPQPVELLGIDSLQVMAAAAEVAPPIWTGMPWGRFRLLLARLGAGGPDPHSARLIPIDQLDQVAELQTEPIVTLPRALALPWPEQATLVPMRQSPLEALGALLLADACTPIGAHELRPLYLVPPDAAIAPTASRVDPQVAIERLDLGDLQALLELEHASFEVPWSAGTLAAELERKVGSEAWGIRLDDGSLGAAGLIRLEVDVLAILSVAVHPRARGRGWGKALVHHVLNRGRDAGALRADLEVRAGNREAIGLYTGLGFAPVGLRRRYYQDGEDALLMSVQLRRPGQAGE
jgi:ribosomal-protein-alanine N-acetyltransferase